MRHKLRDEWSKSPTLAEDPADGHILSGMNSAIPVSGPILADQAGVDHPPGHLHSGAPGVHLLSPSASPGAGGHVDRIAGHVRGLALAQLLRLPSERHASTGRDDPDGPAL